MVDLSVIIVSFNTEGLLKQCLSAIKGHEIIVVDNASSDGSVAMIKTHFPQVRLIENKRNLGFAAATNQGIAQSHGRYLLLLNPDTLALSNALEKLMAFLDSHPRVGIVTGKLLNPDGSFQHGAFRFPNLWMTFFDFFPLNHRLLNSSLNGRYPLSAYTKPFEIDHPLGACLMVRRQVVEEVGPLSEEFFMYCEEVDWCLRIKQAGWLIYCQPEAEIIHYGRQSTQQFWESMFVELHRSRFRLFRKHYSPLFQRAVRWIVRVGLWRETLKAMNSYRGGRITRAELVARCRAYNQVSRIMKSDG